MGRSGQESNLTGLPRSISIDDHNRAIAKRAELPVRLKAVLTVFFCLLVTPSSGQADNICPRPLDQSARTTALEHELKTAATEAEARVINGKLWEIWTTAPNEKAQRLLDSGMAQREVQNFDGALQHFEELVAYCPEYAEGYNQRAFVHFLEQKFEEALQDLEAALSLNDRHIGALSGMALTLMALGKTEPAQKVLQKAVRLNPWLPERAMLSQPPRDRGL